MSVTHNAAALAKRALPNQDAQAAITQKDTTFMELLTALAVEQLTPDKNSGKQHFLGVVTKVLTKSEHLSDMFLSEWYEAQRIDGVSDIDNDSSKVAFLHVPALHTYLTNFDNLNSKKEYTKLTSVDLLKIPVTTTLSVKIGDIVEVTFDNLQEYTGAKIIPIDKKRRKQLLSDKKKFVSSKEVLKKIVACKLLSLDKAEGYAITTKTLINSRNPTYGYEGLYTRLVEKGGLLDSERLKKKVIFATPNSKLVDKKYADKPPFYGVADSADAQGYFTKNISEITFEFKIYASKKIKQYLSQALPVENNAKYSPQIEDLPAQFNKNDPKIMRSLFLEMVLTSDQEKVGLDLAELKIIKDNLITDISKYLSSVITRSFKCEWADVSDTDYFQIDLLGLTQDPALKGGDVDKAIEFSTKKFNASTPSIDSREVSSNEPAIEKKPADKTAKAATDQPVKKTATVKSELPNCEDQSLINNEIYINVEKAKLTSVKRDNKRLKEMSEGFKDPTVPIVQVLYDVDKAKKKGLPSSKLFSYTEGDKEIIASKPEGQKPPQPSKAKKTKQPKKKVLKRTTSIKKIAALSETLANFIKSLKRIIAANEGIEERRVLVFPISVFRKFKRNKKGSGQDQNSRHFFNRAMDFVVYINTADDFKDFTNGIPTKGTYEIPNEILYLYVLKLIELQKVPFGICGLGLLRRGIERKTGYVHYEYMGQLDPEGKDYVQINRRWVSKPKGKKDTSIYGKAFGRRDGNKDSIIKNFVAKEITAKLGILPEKIENLL